MTKPLSGIRIADFTVHNAGPFCTHLLAQLGAEIVKIESAVRLDAFRKPHPVYGRMGAATFDQVASSKLSVRINLKKNEGIGLAKRLVGISDIAAESFRPGVMGRLGLGYDVLSALKPDLVMLCVSSSGQTGPDSHFAGYAPLFGAWGGLGEMTGYADGPPVEMRHVMDHTVGLNSAVAVMAALRKRRATGKGSFVDVSARAVASSLLGEALLLAAAGQEPRRAGNDHPVMVPHGVYPAAGEDRWISIAITSDAKWQSFGAMLGGDAEAACFASAEGRLAHRERLNDIVSAWTRNLDANVAAERLQTAGIAAHASWTTPEIVRDPHLRERRAIVDVAEPDGTKRAAVGVPMRLSKSTNIGIGHGTPRLGEHEDYVFGELLGMTRAERQILEQAEVIH